MVNVGRVGIWSFGLRNDDPNAAGEIREAAAELERLGYDAIWLGGSPGVHHAAACWKRPHGSVVATGILNIWEYDAADVAARAEAAARPIPAGSCWASVRATPASSEGYRKPYSAMARPTSRGSTPRGAPRSGDASLAALGPAHARAVPGPRGRRPPVPRDARAHGAGARRSSARTACWPPRSRSCSTPIPTRARATARRHLGFYLSCPTTRTTCCDWASPRTTSPTAAATAWSTRRSRAGTSRRYGSGSPLIVTRAPTTSSSRCSPTTKRAAPCGVAGARRRPGTGPAWLLTPAGSGLVDLGGAL